MPEKSTTPDLVAVSRRWVDARNRRDVDALVSFSAPDVAWDALAPGDECLEGQTTIRTMLRDWFSTYEEFEMEVDELLNLGNGVVFMACNQKRRLAASSAFVQLLIGLVVLLDGDLAMRLASYLDIDEARATAERLAEERG